MPTVFRITSRKHQPSDPSGALRTPGRWHDLNQAVLYFSSSLPLAILELRARGVAFAEIRNGFHYIAAELDDVGGLESVSEHLFPGAWSTNLLASRKFGSQWYEKQATLCLQVRSAALHSESNYLVNVKHPKFLTLQLSSPKPIPLDARL